MGCSQGRPTVAVVILVLVAFCLHPVAGKSSEITINVDYSDVIIPEIPREIFGLNVVHHHLVRPDSEPVGYQIYRDLAEQCGVTYLRAGGAGYYGRYNWLEGTAGIDTTVYGYSMADWKEWSDSTRMGIAIILSPVLYCSSAIEECRGVDPCSVVQWCIDSGWDPDKWRFWLIGGESYGDWDVDFVEDPHQAAAMVNEIALKLKSVAPDIKIGVPFEIIWKPGTAWCQTILEECGDNLDFVDFHWYPHDGWTDPYGTMQHYPWLEHRLLPGLLSHFNNYLDGRQLDICIGEYDFWGMDGYVPYVPRNTTLADALAWGDFLGEAIRLGVDMAFGYDFVSNASYGFMLWWEELEIRLPPSHPLKIRPHTWVLGMWSKYFGQSMVKATVEGSPSYITQEGRGEWANVDCCPWNDPPYSSYQAIPVDYVTAYAGLHSIDNKASLILINKHNDSSYVLSISLSGLSIDEVESTQIYTLTTDNPEGLMASNPQWDANENEIPPPTVTAMAASNSFDFTLPPHSMVTMRFPVTSGEDAMAPAAVTDLATSDPTSNSITLSWTAPGDDGNAGMASEYDIRYSTASITDANWSSVTHITDEPQPQVAGSSESMTVLGLVPSTAYYFAMKTADEVPNISGLSNVPLGTTQEEPINEPPHFDPATADQSVDERINLTFTVQATDPDGDSIALTASDLPGSAIFTDNRAGSGTFSWTPDYADAGEYLVIFHASDGVNPSVDDQVTIMVNDVDTTSPVLSSISAIEIARHQAAISWNTDEAATSLVEHGLTPSYGSSTSLDTNLVTDHIQLLAGLDLGTLYHYRVRSRDVCGNEAISENYAFRTFPRPGSPRPINPLDGTTLGVPNPDLVILNGIDTLGFQLAHVFQIDTTTGFDSHNLQQSTPFALDQVDDSATLWTVPRELAPGTYYWRAYAYTDALPSDTSNPSRVFAFSVVSSDVVDTAYQLTLEYPLPNEKVGTLRPVLVARLTSGTLEKSLLTCQFELSEDPRFSNNVLSSERTNFSADGTTRWQVTSDLRQNAKFYWRARLHSQDRVLDITQRSTIFTGGIHVFPNPFKPSLGHSQVTFRNIPLNSTIRVTTISGDLVKTFDSTRQTDIVWDVKGEDQNESASGVYLYWVTHRGEVSSGKILVIR